MSSTADHPNLRTWAENHITALQEAKTHAEFDHAFNAFIARDVQVVFNGKHITRDEYKQHLEPKHHEGEAVDVKFMNSVAAAILGAQESKESGVVGLFYDASYTWPQPPGMTGGGHTVISSLNIEAKEETILGSPDRRRVFALNQVHVDYYL